MNYFNPKTSAERYAKGRPDFHSHTINHIRDFLKINSKLENALDIACGTGLSTKALLDIATNVYGTDSSEAMLKYALLPEKINYAIAPAEQQPFNSSFFDLITVCSGVHWFDIDNFLEESNQLLKNHAWLVLYDNYFIAEMEGNDQFTEWYKNVYKVNFPSPPRNNTYDWTDENMKDKNFIFIKENRFKNSVSFTKKQLTLYFTTQSNVIALVEKGETTYEEVGKWLENKLSPFFEGEDMTRTIRYGNWVKFIQRAD